MAGLESEARSAMTVLLQQGYSQSAVARLLGATEGTARRRRRRRGSGAEHTRRNGRRGLWRTVFRVKHGGCLADRRRPGRASPIEDRPGGPPAATDRRARRGREPAPAGLERHADGCRLTGGLGDLSARAEPKRGVLDAHASEGDAFLCLRHPAFASGAFVLGMNG
jgi:hypothetical protein